MTAPGGAHRQRGQAFVAGWRAEPAPVRILRAFLGVTFVYAGLQKFLDPNFFHAGSPDYIGSQLHAFALGSPIAPILSFFAHFPVLTGLCVALAEIAIGIGTLLGIGALPAAIGGFGVSVVLWLSATWHVHPYFLGSDSMYAVGWAALAAGLWEVEQRRRRAEQPRKRSGEVRRSSLGRRELVRGGVLVAGTLFMGGVAKAFEGKPGQTDRTLGSSRGAGASRPAAGAQVGAATQGPQAPASPSPTKPAIQRKVIASIGQLNVGDAVGFQAPGQGPAILVRTGQNQVEAYSRICTHAGCEVGYDPSSQIIVCPCHGAEFDPARGARPIAGPTATPLSPIDVTLDRSTGDVILPS